MCQYLVSRYALDFLTMLLKNTLQFGWAEGLECSSPLFKCHTGNCAPNSSIPMASIEPHGLGKAGPKEVILKLN